MSRRPPPASPRSQDFRKNDRAAGKSPTKMSSRPPRFSAATRAPQVPRKGNSESTSIPKSWRTVVGHHAIKEAFQVLPKTIRELWLKAGFESSLELQAFEKTALDLKIKIQIKSEATLDRLCSTHQGAALLKEGQPKGDDSVVKDHSTFLILDGIEDPPSG